MRSLRVVATMMLLLAACGSDTSVAGAPGVSTTVQPEVPPTVQSEIPAPVQSEVTSGGEVSESEGCADVIGVELVGEADGAFTFHVTVSSPDEGWDKYADEWSVRTLDGSTLGTRTLAHPHETEQPFTRSLSGVEIPEEVTSVVVAARDSVVGYCGETVELTVR